MPTGRTSITWPSVCVARVDGSGTVTKKRDCGFLGRSARPQAISYFATAGSGQKHNETANEDNTSSTNAKNAMRPLLDKSAAASYGLAPKAARPEGSHFYRRLATRRSILSPKRWRRMDPLLGA